MLKALPIQVQQQLRSGFAVSSYAQCLDELILNSVDAKATCIAVRLDFLTKKIQVVDNGTGISRSNMVHLAERYHTSKCESMEDLENELQHYGFRGEALASIRNMCYMLDIESREKSNPYTHCKLFREGKAEEVFESKTHRASAGTTVTIFDLFYTMPVRNKCLNDALELERIRHRTEAIALSHPDISFSLKNETTGNKILQTHKANTVVGTFTHLFGVHKSRYLCAIKAQNESFRVKGYISKHGNSNKSLQFVFINNRLVLKTKFHKLVNNYMRKTVVLKKKGFYNRPDAPAKWSPGSSTEDVGPSKHTERHAIYIINIECPFSAYDITFDPSKTLVEFKDWEGALKCVESAMVEMVERESLLVASTPGQKTSPGVKRPNNGSCSLEAETQDSQEDVIQEFHAGSFGNGCNSNQNIEITYGRNIETNTMSNFLQSETVKRQKTGKGNEKLNQETKGSICDNSSLPVLVTESLEPIITYTEEDPPILVPETTDESDNFDKNTSNEYIESDLDVIPGATLTKAYLQQKECSTPCILQDTLQTNDKCPSLEDSKSMSSLLTDESNNQNCYSAMRQKSLKFDQTVFRKRKGREKKPSKVKVMKYQSTQDVPSSLDEILKISSDSATSDIESFSYPIQRDKTFISLSTQLSSPSTSTCSERTINLKQTKMLSPLQKVKQKYNLMYQKKKHSSMKATVNRTSRNKNRPGKQNSTDSCKRISEKLQVKLLETESKQLQANVLESETTIKDISQEVNSAEADEDPLSGIFSNNKAEQRNGIESNIVDLRKCSSKATNDSPKNKVLYKSASIKTNNKSLLSPLQRIRERLLAKSRGNTLCKFFSKESNQTNKHDIKFKKHSDVSKHKNTLKLNKKSDTHYTDSAVNSGVNKQYSAAPVYQRSIQNSLTKKLDQSEGSPINNKGQTNQENQSASQSVNTTLENKTIVDQQDSNQHSINKSDRTGQGNLSEKISYLPYLICEECNNESCKCKNRNLSVDIATCKQGVCDFMTSKNLIQTAENYNFEEALKSLENSQESGNEIDNTVEHEGKISSNFDLEIQAVKTYSDKDKVVSNTSDYSERKSLNVDEWKSINKERDIHISDNNKNRSCIVTKSLEYDIEYVPIKIVSPVDSIGEICDADTQVKHLYPNNSDSSTPGSIHSEGFDVTMLMSDDIVSKISEERGSVSGNSQNSPESGQSNVIEPSQGFVPSGLIETSFGTQAFTPILTLEANNSSKNGIVSPDHNPEENIPATTESFSDAISKSTVGQENNETNGKEEQIPELVRSNPGKGDTVSDKIELLGNNWICKVDRSGKKLFINTVTGNSSLEPPILSDGNIKTKVLRNRHKAFLLSNNAAPYVDQPKVRVTSKSINWQSHGDIAQDVNEQSKVLKWKNNNNQGVSGPKSKIAGRAQKADMTKMYENWENPMFQQPFSSVTSGEVSGLSREAQLIQTSVQPVRFDKEMLNSIQVLNQVDQKFIACIMKTVDGNKSPNEEKINLLIVVDQHAAHERIRLEQFTRDVYEVKSDGFRQLKRGKLSPPLDVCTTEDTVRLMTAYSKYFSQIGIEFLVSKRDTVSVNTVPICLVWCKDGSDPGMPKPTPFLLRQLQLLIREQIDVLERTGGANTTLPKTIHNVLCSRACHGAIKFGQSLELQECKNLIAQLKKCQLPFQCAHGRPSVMPLLDLNKIKSSQLQTLPRLWKLKQGL